MVAWLHGCQESLRQYRERVRAGRQGAARPKLTLTPRPGWTPEERRAASAPRTPTRPPRAKRTSGSPVHLPAGPKVTTKARPLQRSLPMQQSRARLDSASGSSCGVEPATAAAENPVEKPLEPEEFVPAPPMGDAWHLPPPHRRRCQCRCETSRQKVESGRQPELLRCACRHCGGPRSVPESAGCYSWQVGKDLAPGMVYVCSACTSHFVQRKQAGRRMNGESRDRSVDGFLAGRSAE